MILRPAAHVALRASILCYILDMENNTFQLTDHQKAALEKLGVVLCYLHGSVVAGTTRNDSDADVAVLFEEMPKDPIGITGKLIDIFAGFIQGRELDIAILNEASPLLKQIVASEGRVLYARSSDDTLRFELRAMHEYEYSKHRVRLGQELVLQRAGL